MWAIAIEDKANKKIQLVTADTGEIDNDDPAYGDVHIVPIIEDGEYIMFGCHEFKRNCYCQPEVKIEMDERPMVIHKDRKPN